MACLLGLFFSVPLTLAAFGVSPPWVKTDLLLPGDTFEQTVYLSRSDATEAMRIEAMINGDEVLKNWISIPEGGS